MTDAGSLPYLNFGQLLTQLRSAAGFTKQQDLASTLGISQQTVSRWEKGLARPKAKDVPALEQAVKAKEGELLAAAGYAPSTAATAASASGISRAPLATTIERPLPLGALTPDTFESFSAALLHELYLPEGAHVQRYGGTGHTQHGIDILVQGPSGTHTFQCKRVVEFGAQKVHTAVATQTFKADLKVLLLANVASPSARDAMAVHAGWQLWDREDITRRFHSLPQMSRIDLVDRYFNGQRFDLLGSAEPGPLQSADDFFKPFLVQDRYFNHAWDLVGREAELDLLVKSVQDKSVSMTGLVAPPGAGKSRMLRAVVDRMRTDAQCRVWFVSPTEDIKTHHLDKLRDSRSASTLLVVDDAHDRDDVDTLLQYVANVSNNARLLLSLRPYGRDQIRLKAARASLSGDAVQFVELPLPTRADAIALAEAVLAKCGGPKSAAAGIAAATQSTPLATVLAAQLVAKDQVAVAMLANEDEFRTHVLRSLQDVLAYKLVTGQDTDRLRGVLRVVALLQPVLPDDPRLMFVLQEVEGVSSADATRLMRLLTDAGVLFKRGLRCRLAPDLLADEIIHGAYLDSDGTANEAVHRVFDLASAEQLKHLFSNLGRLDWRLREGETDESPLLNSLAPKLSWKDEHGNPHVEAVEAIAYYHPRFALNFAKQLIKDGHGRNASVCNIVRNAAYTYSHLEEACALLWKAGKDDERELHQHPSHGMRILKGLAEFEPNKPVAYVERAVRFALDLLERPASLNGAHTPFTVLEGALNTEMESSTFSGSTFTIHRYQLPVELAKEVRRDVASALLRYLRGSDQRRAYLAARLVSHALQGPRHGDTPDSYWKNSQVELLKQLRSLCEEVELSPVVLVRLVRSCRWHADYGWPESSVEAKAIAQHLNRDLRTRLVRFLVDGWGTETWNISKDGNREEHRLAKEQLTSELLQKFTTPSELFDELNFCLQEIATTGRGSRGAEHLFVNPLLVQSPRLAKEVLLRNDAGEAGQLSGFAGAALSSIVTAGDSELLAEYVERSESSLEALGQLTEAYLRFEPSRPYTDAEKALFKRAFQSKDTQVLWLAAQLARQVAHSDPSLALELICLADFSALPRATHDMFMLLSGDANIPQAVVDTERSKLLSKLKPMKDLDDYWLQAFLAASMKQDPKAVMDLVKARLDARAATKDWSYVPMPKDYQGQGLGLMEVESGQRLLVELLEHALTKSEDDLPRFQVGEVAAALCGAYTQPVLDALLAWMRDGPQAKVNLAAAVLREGQSRLIYDHPKFARDILSAAELLGEDAVDGIRAALATTVLTGVRTGTPGQPFEEDVALEKYCLEMLTTLSRAEPAYELYDALLKDARHSISRKSQSDRHLFAEED